MTLSRDAGNGILAGTTLGSITTARAYNPFGEVDSDQADFGATGFYAATYTRDKLGRITQKVETVEGVTHTYDYSYDPGGHLERVEHDGVPVEAYLFDANGMQVAYVKAPPIDYVVDGANRRIGKMVDGVLVQSFLYGDALNPLAELEGTGAVAARFVYGSKPTVPVYDVKADGLPSGGLTGRSQRADLVGAAPGLSIARPEDAPGAGPACRQTMEEALAFFR